VLLEDAGADAFDRTLAGVGVADDATFADVGATGFELRLDEDDYFAVPGLVGGAECAEYRRKHEGRGDEGDVHRNERWSGCAGCEEFAGGEEAGVGSFAQGDARIVAQLMGDLAVAGVHGEDGDGPALEHAVGEAASRCSDVRTREAGEFDGPVGEGALELETAAADVLEVGAEEANDGVGGDGGTWFVNTLLVDEDAARKDKGLGTFARGGMTLVYEKLVNTVLWRLAARKLYEIAHRLDFFKCILIDKEASVFNSGGDEWNAGVIHELHYASILRVK
jgi:hypothetical protein